MKNLTLEVSLKPFKQTDDEYINKVCTDIFEQWKPLAKGFSQVSVMLWTADGSEILDYGGDISGEFEWCRFAGGANPETSQYSDRYDPERLGLHLRRYDYMESPPVMTYAILKKIVSSLKICGRQVLGENVKIRVGETFDVGPEFAVSDFKYNRHREVCSGGDMGEGTMLCSYEKLKGDTHFYAAYPEGIPDGTPFGTFFGKQVQIFLTDMGFDYIWFSNGLGFGRETWSATGAVFNGESFEVSALESVKASVLEFWELFRNECPDFPVETRGTNMSMGIDLAGDGVPLKDIYEGGFNMLPPCNSPWAALDGDFGLELMGHMSRIAQLPGDDFLFRYYIHDPWWVNSPWYDRYDGQPHDIYLPMSIGRIDEKGRVKTATHLNLLSIDNTWGDMPDCCAYEPMPHLMKAIKDAPDAPSPVVWVYPFSENSSACDAFEVSEMYSNDWYIRGCINNGAPITTVISTDNFIKVDKSIFSGSVIVSPVPKADSEYERALLTFALEGKVILYGSLSRCSEKILSQLGVRIGDEEYGEKQISVGEKVFRNMIHGKVVNSDGINTYSDNAFAKWGDYAVGVHSGNVVWLRGSVSCDYKPGQRLLVPHSDRDYFISESLMCTALEIHGFCVEYDRVPGQRNPVTMISSKDNGLIFSVYTPSTSVKTRLKTPLGAPLLAGYEAVLEDGFSTYHFPKAEHRECRVFVSQESGIISVSERHPVSVQHRRMVEVSGLENAVVRFFGESYCMDRITALLNPEEDARIAEPFEYRIVTDAYGTYFEAKNITGRMVFCMPDDKHTNLPSMPKKG